MDASHTASASSCQAVRLGMCGVLALCAVVSASVLAVKVQGRRTTPASSNNLPGPSNPRVSAADSNQCRNQNRGNKIVLAKSGNAHIACPNGNCDFEASSAWYVNIDPIASLSLSDGHSHTDTFVPGKIGARTIPDVTYNLTCRDGNCLSLTMPTVEKYTLTFTSHEQDAPIILEIVRGIGNICPDEVVRYLDLNLPRNSTAMLEFSPQGVSDLRIDGKGDKNFKSVIAPTARALAPASWDVDGPIMRFSSRPLDAGSVIVKLTASDESGVRQVYYSVDGGPPSKYEKPFKVNRTAAHKIAAFADDAVGNRSGLYTFGTSR